MRLSSEQEAAITAPGPRVLVRACPGAGKTEVLTARLAREVERAGVERVAAVTFTRKAAEEMRARLAVRLGAEAVEVRIGTIHSLCLEVVRRLTGVSPELAGEAVRRRALAEAAGVTGTDPRRVAARITRAKAAGHTRDPLVQVYQEALEGAWDFDDLLLGARRLLAAGGWDGVLPWKHLLVDEAQDLNPIQVEVLRLLAGRPGATVFMVGDPDQAIYGFRGADPGLLEGFPWTTRRSLAVNWRSRRLLVERAVRLASRRYVPAREEAGRLEWHQARDREEELAWLVERIGREARPWEVAVLLRTNAEALRVAAALREAGVPVLDQEGLSSAERFEGLRALVATLAAPRAVDRDTFFLAARTACVYLGASWRTAVEAAAADGGGDLWEATRAPMPRRWMVWRGAEFRRLVGRLWEGYRRTRNVQAVLAEMVGYLERTPEARFDLDEEEKVEFLRLAEGVRSLRALARKLARLAERSRSGVRVMTVHAAKGLEFPVVYVPFLDQGSYPHRLAEDEAEERRLLYVALTRAKDRLVTSWTRGRRSPFLARLGLPPVDRRRFLWLFTRRVEVASGHEGQGLEEFGPGGAGEVELARAA
jgi:DNA helicase-2/ATP-dependent DNA helicase PcrA